MVRSSRPPAPRPTSARPAAAWRWLEAGADVATIALVVWHLASLAERASGTLFQTDECFHAHVAERIAAHPGLPRILPEFYSGFYYYYPPLFHLLGAAWCALFGAPALRYLNVFVTAVLFSTVYLGCWGLRSRAAGRWAVALCAANSWLAMHSMRFYVEQLTTLLSVGAILLVLWVRREPRARSVALLGVVTGLTLLAKHSALILLGVLGVLVALYAMHRDGRRARAYAISAGLALLVALPMFIRNQVLYGSPIYPALAPDLHPLLYALNKATYTPQPHTFYLATALYAGPGIGLVMIAALALAALRRRASLETGLIGLCLGIYAAAPLQPLLDSRHMLPLIVTLAVLGSLEVTRGLHDRPAIRTTIGLVLLALAVHFVPHMPRYRRLLDPSAESLQAFEAVRRNVPEGERVLSLATYDTFYYGRRPATWPIPWGQTEHPVEMFLTSDSDSVLRALQRHRLRYLLVSRVAQGPTFNGANYPLPFLQCVSTLLAQDRMEVLWSTRSTALVRVVEP